MLHIKRIRQYKKICKTKIPKQLEEYVDEEKLAKSIAYQKDNYRFAFVTDALDIIETILMFEYVINILNLIFISFFLFIKFN